MIKEKNKEEHIIELLNNFKNLTMDEVKYICEDDFGSNLLYYIFDLKTNFNTKLNGRELQFIKDVDDDFKKEYHLKEKYVIDIFDYVLSDEKLDDNEFLWMCGLLSKSEKHFEFYKKLISGEFLNNVLDNKDKIKFIINNNKREIYNFFYPEYLEDLEEYLLIQESAENSIYCFYELNENNFKNKYIYIDGKIINNFKYEENNNRELEKIHYLLKEKYKNKKIAFDFIKNKNIDYIENIYLIDDNNDENSVSMFDTYSTLYNIFENNKFKFTNYIKLKLVKNLSDIKNKIIILKNMNTNMKINSEINVNCFIGKYE